MKTTILFLALITFMVTACSDVLFEEPQPVDTNELKSIPPELIGTFVNKSDDTLTITENSFHFSNETSSIPTINGDLTGGESVLKMLNEHYVLSSRVELDTTYWTVLIINVTKKGLSVNYFPLDDAPDKKKEKLIKRIQNITEVREIEDSVDNYNLFLLAPTKLEFEKLVKEGVFDEKEEFKKIE